jgi:hypothetical protein
MPRQSNAGRVQMWCTPNLDYLKCRPPNDTYGFLQICARAAGYPPENGNLIKAPRIVDYANRREHDRSIRQRIYSSLDIDNAMIQRYVHGSIL